MSARVENPSTSGRKDAPALGRRVRAAALAAAIAAAPAAGCASTYALFAAEKDIPSCAQWLEEARSVPAEVRRVEAGTVEGRPFRLEVEERGTGARDRLLVLVHGVLSDRRTWRFMVGSLGADHDLLLVDLPGCGGSDRPDPALPGPGAYAPDALARAVLTVLRARVAARPARPAVALVGHSLGSAVILRALGSPALRTEFADVIGLVDGAVLFSPLDFSFTKRDPLFEKVAGVTGFEIAVGNIAGLVREGISRSVREGVEDPASTPREEVDRIWEILSDAERRAAAQAMIRSAVPFTGDGLPDWPRVEVLESDYARVRVPCLLVSGARDDALPGALSFKLRQQLPSAWLRVLPRSGHSLPTERPGECSRLLRAFVETRGEGWAAYGQERPDAALPRSLAGAPRRP
jgi:pimeloyl-ACP methyl ester carboxylesterase